MRADRQTDRQTDLDNDVEKAVRGNEGRVFTVHITVDIEPT